MTVSSPAAIPADPRALELKLLVDMVRLSRATLLVAEAGADKSALIRSTVMPLLTAARAGGRSEIAILFDGWDKAPLPALHACIHEAAERLGAEAPASGSTSRTLVASLRNWQERLGVTFFIVFDRFEAYLGAPRGRTGYTEFEDELVSVANDPTLRANFLFALEEQAEPLLARLRERIPRLGYSRVRLPRTSPPVSEQPRTARETSVVEMARRLAAEKAAAAAPAAKKSPPPPKAAAIESPSAVTPAHKAPVSVLPIATPPASPASTPALDIPAPKAPIDASTAARSTQPASQKAAAAANAQAAADAAIPQKHLATPSRVRAGADASAKAVARNDLAEVLATASPREDTDARRPSRWTRWAFAAIAIAGLALFLQPRGQRLIDAPLPDDRVDGKSAPTTPAASSEPDAAKSGAMPKPARSVPMPAPPRVAKPEAVAASEGPSAAAVAQTNPPARAVEKEARSPVVATVQAPPSDVPRRAEALPPKNAQNAAAKPVAATPTIEPPREIASAPAKAVSARPEARPPATQPARAAETATIRAAAAPRPQAEPRAATVAKAPAVSPPAPTTTAEAPAGPRLYIHVRTESQRAWAEQIARPLADRGIRVAGIRMVNSGPEQADLRYHNLSERDELLKVAVALREFGLAAQQLKHVEDTENPGSARQYELWLPASGYDRRP